MINLYSTIKKTMLHLNKPVNSKKQIFVILGTLIFLQINAQKPAMNNWKTQMDLKFFSTIQYPPDWTINDINEDGYIIRSPMDSLTDSFRENVAVFAVEIPDEEMKEDIKKVAEINFEPRKKMIQELRLMTHRYVLLNGVKMYLLVYNGLYNGNYFYWKELYCTHKNALYVITYTGVAGVKDKYAIISGDILSSFKPNNVTDG